MGCLMFLVIWISFTTGHWWFCAFAILIAYVFRDKGKPDA